MSEHGKFIDRTAVQFTRLLPGPIERVWAFLVESDKRLQWFCGGEFELRPGGVAHFQFDHRRITSEKPPKKHEHHGGEISFDGVIVEAAPPGLLVFDWPEEDGSKTRVRIELADEGDKVRLTLTHSMLEKRETLLDVSGGWHAHLDMLEAVLAGAPRPRFWEAITRYEADYEEMHKRLG